MNPHNKKMIRDLALQRMKLLYRYALNEVRRNNIKLARRYIYLIKRIAAKTRVKVPKRIKRSICKNCQVPLIPGITSRVRLQSEGKGSRIVITCLVCGWIHRYPYKLCKGKPIREHEVLTHGYKKIKESNTANAC